MKCRNTNLNDDMTAAVVTNCNLSNCKLPPRPPKIKKKIKKEKGIHQDLNP